MKRIGFGLIILLLILSSAIVGCGEKVADPAEQQTTTPATEPVPETETGPAQEPETTQSVAPEPEETVTTEPEETVTTEPEPEEPATPEPEEISWRKAGNHVGETITVCGEAVTVFSGLEYKVINLGEIPSEGGVIIVIPDPDMISEELFTSYYSEILCVTGEVTQDTNDNIGIYVTDPSQITLQE